MSFFRCWACSTSWLERRQLCWANAMDFNVLEGAERRVILSTKFSDDFAVVDAFGVRVMFLTFSCILYEL